MKNNKILPIVIGIIILAAVLLGGYKVAHRHSTSQMSSTSVATSSNPSQPSGQEQSNSISNKGTSNSDIDADIQNIQGSMTKLSQDQSTAAQDTSSQDTPQQ